MDVCRLLASVNQSAVKLETPGHRDKPGFSASLSLSLALARSLIFPLITVTTDASFFSNFRVFVGKYSDTVV